MQNYKELKVWEKSHQFALEIYSLTTTFPKEEIYSLTSQLRRAAISVPCNIAEGCGKNSQKDFANFLHIGLGSANECEYLLMLARDLTYVSTVKFLELENMINNIKAMLLNLIAKIKSV